MKTKRLRHCIAALAVGAVFALGQLVAALHGLGHATQEIAHHDSTPESCEDHSLFCSVGNAVAAQAPVAPLVAAAVEPAAPAGARSASVAPRFSFHSRAPPPTLA